MIDSTLKTPRTAAIDGMEKQLKVDDDEADDTRNKCVVMLYNALAIDSRAGELSFPDVERM
jgi:transcription elongation factor S-II